MLKKIILISLIFYQLFFVNSANSYSTSSADIWKKQRWIYRVANHLSLGRINLSKGQLEDLMKMDEEKILNYLLQQEEVEDFYLSLFNYFWGYSSSNFRNADGFYEPNLTQYATNITATIQALNDGNIFHMFNEDQPFYIQPLENVFDLGPGEDQEIKRLFYLEKFVQLFYNQVEQAEKDLKNGETNKNYCYRLSSEFDYATLLFKSGFDTTLVGFGIGKGLFWPLYEKNCEKTRQLTQNDLDDLRVFSYKIHKIVDELKGYSPIYYKPKNIGDMKVRFLKDFGINKKSPPVVKAFKVNVPNTSTNFNRKRAAYFLKQFFCEDLIPLPAIDGVPHFNSGRHASDPKCQACHYKLDPFAGFFKDYGLQFTNFSKKDHIIFDDDFITSKTKYQDTWKALPDSGRVWDIGFIRSRIDDSKNSWGEDFSDLLSLLKSAPEVKECIARKTFEYFLGPDQNVSDEYVSYLAQDFISLGNAKSGVALKKIVKKILVGNTYRTFNRNKGSCYDYPPGQDPKNSPPCEMATILKNSCVACHSSTTGAGRLDLSKWITVGTNSTFPHLDVNGNQIARKTTFSTMIDRISTKDKTKRMPIGLSMPEKQRERLYKWLVQNM